MSNRTDLQTILESTIGSRNVYFQPPENKQIDYPCIVYGRSLGDTKFAADNPYLHTIRYQLIVIDKDPDSIILGKVAMLPKCLFVRHYTASNLNHDVYDIYY